MKSKPIIKIYTHRGAREVDAVIDELRFAGADVQRQNFCTFPEKSTSTLGFGDGYDTPAAAWVHDLNAFSVERSLTGISREIAVRECTTYLNGLLLRENAHWLNSPTSIWKSGNKPFQLAVAEKLSLPVPKYVITNDAKTVEKFMGKHKQIVVKALDAAFINYGRRGPLKVFTRRVNALTPEIQSGLQFGPAIFQQEIKRSYEVRVTVVDGKAFSIALDTRGLPDGVVDVRELDYEKERERFFRPQTVERIEKLSILLCQSLDLNYAGLDWAIEPSGKLWFFEANPCGAFRWFEEVGAGRITAAITSALLNRARNG